MPLKRVFSPATKPPPGSSLPRSDWALRPVYSAASRVDLEKEESALSLLKNDSDLKDADMVAVVMGPTGAGKSRFIAEASGLSVDIGDSLHSETRTVQAYHFEHHGSHVALVDTPGFDDTHRPDTAIFRDLSAWLAARYQEKTRLMAIIYIQPITLTRVSGSILRNLTVMKRMLGVQSFPHLTLVTSMWDTIDPSLGEKREAELQASFWSDLVQFGAKTARFSGDATSAAKVLDTASSKDEILMTIQRELVDQGLTLDRTAAGTYLDSEILGLIDAAIQDPSRKGLSSRLLGKLGGKGSEPGRADKQQELEQLGPQRYLKASWDPDYGSLWLEPAAPPQPIWDAGIYTTLREDQFRLIELKAGEGSAPLEIELVVRSFSQASKYVALSYVVGTDHKLKQLGLRFQKSLFKHEIAENLHSALSHLRQPGIDIAIWVDALSINPASPDERARQIRKMSRIFRHADNVCIWLGEEDENNRKAMDLAQGILDFDYFEAALSDPSVTENFLQLANLMGNPWFRRRWCVQEILLAKSATIHCGHRVMPWLDFVDAVTLLRPRWIEIQHRVDGKTRHRLGHAYLIGAVALIEVSAKIVRRTPNGDVIDRLLDLETLLSMLPTFEVTFMHDTVYAIYDLARDVAGTNRLQVDYSKEPRDLFREATELIVKSSGSLDIICQPWAPKAGLPSWIPTTEKLPYSLKPRPQGTVGSAEVLGALRSAVAAGKTLTGFSAQSTLPVYIRKNGCVLVGTPDSRSYRACGHYSSRGHVEFRAEGSQLVLSARGIPIGTVALHGGECINGNIPSRWMELGMWDELDSRPVPPVFWRTLVADRGPDGLPAPGWYKRACEFAFRRNASAHIDVEELYSLTESSHVREFLRRVRDVCWSRALVNLSASQESAAAGRSCGGSGGVASSSSSPPQQPIISLCPPETSIGDVVAILYGCSVPVVLRPQVSASSSSSYYTLIGECFVYGFVDGEIMTDDNKSRLCSRIYDII
ncbi:hypothetical protein Z517_03380 [Fonsecaea pedrosoi CBS 271.37]|uniref:Heterokaryon incompatibility domain-containing protein n=1 Tax=Fonsecaea pedrosoi CBS 271.37 TaxID=1442368 RepID=A0A0D2GT03_9EURO|nr:uncharacterized protein Z517_03380 [Fonsecaea pedrosoi CBS 271.37]KIW84133.1 hypothetical protein Z517_03380 [Fonsecaea pedrosoi CBS 271.37]